jgi:two-component system sensor kinase FixL
VAITNCFYPGAGSAAINKDIHDDQVHAFNDSDQRIGLWRLLQLRHFRFPSDKPHWKRQREILMLAEDKLTRGGVPSEKFPGPLVASAHAPSSGAGQSAAQSLERNDNQAEDILQAILGQAVVGFVKSDPAGRITFVNDRYCEITGYSRDELLGRQWLELTHPDDRPANTAYLRRLSNNKPSSFEKRYVRKNGEIIWVNLCAGQRRDAGSQYFGGAAFVVDISERKLAEELLRQSSEEIADLYNHAPCGYHSLDRDSIICKMNDTELGWLGYRRDEVIGKIRWPDLLTRSSQEAFASEFPRFKKQGVVHGFEIELIRRDGTVFTGLVNATAIYASNGDYLMSRSTVFDITERKRLESELHRSEENLNRAQAVAQIGSWVLDIPGGRLEWSAETYRMFGIPPQEAIDLQTFFAVIHPDDRDFVMDAWSKATADDVPYDIEHRIVAEGQTRWVRERAQIERDPEGQPVTGIGTVQDITERKILELELQEGRREMAELQKLHVAAQTAAAIAHELNQPLMAITSYGAAARMLLQADNPDLDRIRDAVEAGERQAHRAGQSIRELLEFLDIKEVITEPFDINREILEVMDAARSERELKFHCTLHLEHGLPLVRANRMHIQKVLLNLLHNGIEAMQAAGVPLPSITVKVRTAKDDGVAQVTIQDNGPGIRKEDFERLFEPFFTTKTRGIGMGLSVSRSLIEANGGQLWLDPQDGPGAIFHITLPFAR